MGTNRGHEMGIGSTNQQKYYSPVQVQGLERHIVIRISAGTFSGAVTSNKELLIWGSGDFGVLSQPQKVFLDEVKFTDLRLSKQ
jgi:hypothetical protein